MRLVSAHISQWDVNFARKWDSALKGAIQHSERMLRGPWASSWLTARDNL